MSKKLGDIAESIFITRCLMNNISISTPFGDNEKFDFITEHCGNIKRVQVKCTDTRINTGLGFYKVCGSRGNNSKYKYKSEDIDVLAAFIFPEQVWYIIPITENIGATLRLMPNIDKSKGKYEKFKNKFILLKGEEKSKSDINEDIVKNFKLL